MDMRIKKITQSAKTPKYATKHSAGMDLCADILEPITILPNETRKIPTGIAVETPIGYGSFIFARSGLATKYGIAPANCVGVIDSDYRGEVIVALHNSSENAFIIQPNERIAQLVVMPVVSINLIEVDKLTDTARDTGGFGSTGID